MFWGIILEPGVKYTTNVDRATRISNAALAFKSPDDRACVKLQCAGTEFIVCHLDGRNHRNSVIDLAFEQGEPVVLFADGTAGVHLTGLCEDEQEDDSDDEESEDETVLQALQQKRKRKGADVQLKESPADAKRPRKLEPKKSDTTDEEEEDDSDFEFGGIGDSDEDEDEVGDEDDEEGDLELDSDDLESFDEDAEMDDDDDDEEEKPTPAKKKGQKASPAKSADKNKQQGKKQEAPSPAVAKKANGEAAVNGADQEGKKKNKKKNKKNKENKEAGADTPKAAQSPAKGTESAQKTVNKKGVIITTLKPGTGPVAKPGKTVHVYYRGRFQKGNKEFDKVVDGKGFAFRLGGGEVIKGWDVGVEGMAVGEKRRLVVPGNLAYGPKGIKPDIPPNATLVFDVELKALS